jgi:hypothetical protein
LTNSQEKVITDYNNSFENCKFHIKKGIVYKGDIPLHRILINRRATFLNGITTDCRKANLIPFKYDPQKSKE